MYSVGKAEESIRNSEFEKAKKMMESTDQLCVRYESTATGARISAENISGRVRACAGMEGTSMQIENEALKCGKMFAKKV